MSSVTEPSIAIIAACAPALRRLFTFFAPRYFSETGTYAYTNNATHPNTRPRKSNSVHYDVDKELGIKWNETDDNGQGHKLENEQEIAYGMTNLRSKVSREDMPMQRTQSVRTGVSESASQPYSVPTEPFDVLDQRR